MMLKLHLVDLVSIRYTTNFAANTATASTIEGGPSSDFFTSRRLAKRGICSRRVFVRLSVCVCVCVCHTPVLYQNG